MTTETAPDIDVSNVVFLKGCCEIPVAQPVPSVIEFLEATLERARRGDIIAAAVATVNDQGGLGTGWRFGTAPETGLVMAVQDLAHRMMARRHS